MTLTPNIVPRAVVQFRLWWDVARAVSLLVIHSGSSAVFMLYRPKFPCRGFDTETFCKDFVFAIFSGCWIISGSILCFSITLGIMAFLPRPVESVSGSAEAGSPFSPASFKAGSFFDEERPPSLHFFDSRMGSIPLGDTGEFPDESLSPARTRVPVNRAPQKSPHLWQSSQTQRLGNSANGPMHTKTTITKADGPVKPASVDVKSERQDTGSLYLNLFSARSPSPLPNHTPASEASNESPSVSRNMPSWPHTAPKLMYGARSVTMDHNRAAPYTPTIHADPGAHSFSATFRESHQPYHMYPDVVQTASPRVYSLHSATASVYSKWTVSPPHNLPPPVLTPRVAHSTHFHLQDPPSKYRARKTSEPNGGDRNISRRSNISPVTEGSFQRRGSDGQVVDHTQWRRLVLGAADKP
ncbi:hypothetical protein EI94DRAFT_14528 [Lactarius quietus]|nr:hypothetical protein EI94DRAFT_14528 [Lactarius quietus]